MKICNNCGFKKGNICLAFNENVKHWEKECTRNGRLIDTFDKKAIKEILRKWI